MNPKILGLVALIYCALASLAQGCSVLSHEAIVDAMWDVELKPVLKAEYPGATPEELKAAHGYAYGGAIIQDLGYYPHGSKEFSDLAHYVRTGDFVMAMIHESQDLNELAFALGALSHYVSDIDVHRYATNVGEGELYPKLERKFGPIVTYEDAPGSHLRTEFGFDVLEVARGNFAPQAYHDFIGFGVSKDLLNRAFHRTYGLDLKQLFADFDKSVESYRHDVSGLIPKATRIAWSQRKNQIQKSQPGMTRDHFVYVMRRSSYEKNWGKQYDRPSAGERFLGFVIELLPPIGPLRALHFKMPTPNVEKLFMASFDRSSAGYHEDLKQLDAKGLNNLRNINFDIGVVATPGQYRLEDDSYVYWLHQLAKDNFSEVTPAIRDDISAYLKSPKAAAHTRSNPKNWDRVENELGSLKAAHAS